LSRYNKKSYIFGILWAALSWSCSPIYIVDDIRMSEGKEKVKVDPDSIDVTAGYDFKYSINLSHSQKQKIGKQIFQNETGGDPKKLVHWNIGEDFPSLGIAHFIWIPQNANVVFGDSFKSLAKYYKGLGVRLPSILERLSPNFECPWRNSSEFWSQRSTTEVMELERFLRATFDIQVTYVIERLRRDLPSVFEGLSLAQQKLIDKNINSLSSSKAGWYPVVDYLNFKGSGSSQIATNYSGGWGLRQVLLGMNPNSSNPPEAFYVSAKAVLSKRISYRSQDERWREGWNKRVYTYVDFDINADSSSFE
jgi:hypothetical protein